VKLEVMDKIVGFYFLQLLLILKMNNVFISLSKTEIGSAGEQSDRDSLRTDENTGGGILEFMVMIEDTMVNPRGWVRPN